MSLFAPPDAARGRTPKGARAVGWDEPGVRLPLDKPPAAAAGDSAAKPDASPVPKDERFLVGLFQLMAVSLILLQKLALPGNIEVLLPIAWAAFMVTAFKGLIGLDPGRLLLFGLYCACAMTTQFMQTTSFSQNSMFLAFAINAALCFKYEISAESYLKCMRFFMKLIIGVCIIVIIQQVVQFTVGPQYWPNLNLIIPDQFQYKSFNYLQPIAYKSIYMKPHGFIFLETSILSQFLCLGLIVELCFFRRPLIMVMIVGILFSTMAGTGMLLLLACAPFILAKLGVRAAIVAVVGAIAVAGIAFALGWYDTVGYRLGEFGKDGSSGNQRFVVPAMYLIDMSTRGREAFIGVGAGNIPQVSDEVWWAFTKVAGEYGIMAAILFYAYLCFALFFQAPSKLLAFACLFFYSFLNGSYANPLFGLTLMTLCTLFRIKPDPEHPKGVVEIR